MLKRLRARGEKVAATTDFESFVAFDRDGTSVGLPQLIAPGLRMAAVQRAVERYARSPGNSDVSVAHVLDSAGALDGLDGRSARLMDFLLYATLHQPLGIGPELLSAKLLPTSFDYPGGEHLLGSGMEAVLDLMDPDLDVVLDTPVEEIQVLRGAVRAVTPKGTYEADQCICALPLGVLKTGSPRFDPPLPIDLVNAIDVLQVGDFYKLALRFEDPFWDQDHDFTASIAEAGRYGGGRHCAFLHLDRAHGEPLVVMIAASDFARELETVGVDRATSSALERLRAAYGRSVPRPLDQIATAWRQDPWSNGAYSAHGVGTRAADIEAFHRLRLGRITFAGEHTSVRTPGTVHGAEESGRRAAQVLLGR